VIETPPPRSAGGGGPSQDVLTDPSQPSAVVDQGPSRASWSRRRFLKTTALGVAAVAAGGLADEVLRNALGGSAGPASAGFPGSASIDSSPVPSPDNRIRYLSRPDLAPPPIAIEHRAPGLAPGLIFLTPDNGTAPDGPLIVDDRGEPVWFHPEQGSQATILRAGTYRGEPVLTWWEGTISTGGTGTGEYVVADASYREITRVRAANGYQGDLHEFFIGSNGTAFFLISNTIDHVLPFPTGPVPGKVIEAVIQEVEISTGELLFEWHSAAWIDPSESYLSVPTDGTPYDYIHANSLDVDADGNLLLSARHTSTVYKIDRQSGTVLWRLNGRRSDFAMGDGAAFAWQHDAKFQPGGLSIFDDGAMSTDGAFEKASRGIVLALDTTAMTATLTRAFVHPAGVLATSQGSMELLSTGGAFVGWGHVPRYSEFDASGALVLDATFPVAVQSYRVYRFPWIGRPAEPPAVAAVRSSNGLIVYASWNGATEVAVWQVLGGPNGNELKPIGRARSSGFETPIEVVADAPFIAVSALDDGGSELGRSEVTEAV
jgi:hypothetical protein